MSERETVRCPKCELVQFRPVQGCCRRCNFAAWPWPPLALAEQGKAEPGPGPLAVRMRRIRMAHGMSQSEFAKAIYGAGGYHVQISRLENRRKPFYSATAIIGLIQALNLPPEYLFAPVLPEQEEAIVAAFVVLPAEQRARVLTEARKLMKRRKEA